ncbi:ABC transporter ATP-binding protein [Phenylobacterium sp.]|uniref:ABC transporter ATP-binding protein n=1 Tax=Phenylobacterium sp. TaxID=1871053 RepID=UPI003BACD14A
MTTLIELLDVSKEYHRRGQGVPVLQHLDLQVARGEFLALVGPSGSGKSTLLNLMAGLDRPTSGRIVVDGQSLEALSESELATWRARHVGFVFQFYNLMPVLTASQNVELPLLLTGLSARERQLRVAAALELVNLADRRKHKPAELSGGQQQRVAIARAIVADPMLLICDEPTGDLDREAADEVLGLLRLLQEVRGATIVMVTHDPRAAASASRILRLDKGVLTPEARGLAA